jgi:hypothetical protein
MTLTDPLAPIPGLSAEYCVRTESSIAQRSMGGAFHYPQVFLNEMLERNFLSGNKDWRWMSIPSFQMA